MNLYETEGGDHYVYLLCVLWKVFHELDIGAIGNQELTLVGTLDPEEPDTAGERDSVGKGQRGDGIIRVTYTDTHIFKAYNAENAHRYI